MNRLFSENLSYLFLRMYNQNMKLNYDLGTDKNCIESQKYKILPAKRRLIDRKNENYSIIPTSDPFFRAGKVTLLQESDVSHDFGFESAPRPLASATPFVMLPCTSGIVCA